MDWATKFRPPPGLEENRDMMKYYFTEGIPLKDLRSQVLGQDLTNLKYLSDETGMIVSFRGRGSGFIDVKTGRESDEPPHLYVKFMNDDKLVQSEELLLSLMDTVEQELGLIKPKPSLDCNAPLGEKNLYSNSINRRTKPVPLMSIDPFALTPGMQQPVSSNAKCPPQTQLQHPHNNVRLPAPVMEHRLPAAYQSPSAYQLPSTYQSLEVYNTQSPHDAIPSAQSQLQQNLQPQFSRTKNLMDKLVQSQINATRSTAQPNFFDNLIPQAQYQFQPKLRPPPKAPTETELLENLIQRLISAQPSQLNSQQVQNTSSSQNTTLENLIQQLISPPSYPLLQKPQPPVTQETSLVNLLKSLISGQTQTNMQQPEISMTHFVNMKHTTDSLLTDSSQTNVGSSQAKSKLVSHVVMTQYPSQLYNLREPENQNSDSQNKSSMDIQYSQRTQGQPEPKRQRKSRFGPQLTRYPVQQLYSVQKNQSQGATQLFCHQQGNTAESTKQSVNQHPNTAQIMNNSCPEVNQHPTSGNQYYDPMMPTGCESDTGLAPQEKLLQTGKRNWIYSGGDKLQKGYTSTSYNKTAYSQQAGVGKVAESTIQKQGILQSAPSLFLRLQQFLQEFKDTKSKYDLSSPFHAGRLQTFTDQANELSTELVNAYDQGRTPEIKELLAATPRPQSSEYYSVKEIEERSLKNLLRIRVRVRTGKSGKHAFINLGAGVKLMLQGEANQNGDQTIPKNSWDEF